MVILTAAPIMMNVPEKMVVTHVTPRMHHAPIMTVHTPVNVIMDIQTQTPAFKQDSNVNSLLTAMLTMVVAPTVVKFQMVVHVMKCAGLLTIHWLTKNADQRKSSKIFHFLTVRASYSMSHTDILPHGSSYENNRILNSG